MAAQPDLAGSLPLAHGSCPLEVLVLGSRAPLGLSLLFLPRPHQHGRDHKGWGCGPCRNVSSSPSLPSKAVETVTGSQGQAWTKPSLLAPSLLFLLFLLLPDAWTPRRRPDTLPGGGGLLMVQTRGWRGPRTGPGQASLGATKEPP